MSTSLRYFAAAAAAATCSVTAAELPAPLGETVVTATRTPTEVSDVLAPLIVISRADLARSLAPDVANLLQFHAGIDIARNGGPGQTTSVFIRGTDSNQATVLIDGVRINPGTIGGAQVQNISPEAVDRIEIVKGPRSTLYGTDAIGGVINVITRRYATSSFHASADYGSYDTRQASAGGGFNGEHGELAFTGVWYDTQGFPTRTMSDIDCGFENTTGSLRGRLQVGAAELGARIWHASGTTHYLGFFLEPLSQDFKNSSAAVDMAFSGGERWDSRVTFSRIEDEIDQKQSADHTSTRRDALDWQSDMQLTPGQLLTAGVLLTRENTDSLEFGTGYDEDTDVNMFYLQDRIDIGPNKLLMALAYTDHESFGSETTWNFEYGRDFASRTRVILSAGTGFRAPDSTDRFGFGGNPDLEPETSLNVELGLQQKIGTNQFLTLSAFRNQIDNLIEFVVTDPLTFEGHNENVDEALIKGIELAYEIQAEDWRLRVEAIAQDPLNVTTDEELLRRARRSASVSVVKAFGAHELGLNVLMTGDRKDFGGVTLDAYTLLNLYGRFVITPAWSLQMRLENVLNEQYELANTYNTPDRSLFVAARYEFQ